MLFKADYKWRSSVKVLCRRGAAGLEVSHRSISGTTAAHQLNCTLSIFAVLMFAAVAVVKYVYKYKGDYNGSTAAVAVLLIRRHV